MRVWQSSSKPAVGSTCFWHISYISNAVTVHWRLMLGQTQIPRQFYDTRQGEQIPLDLKQTTALNIK